MNKYEAEELSNEELLGPPPGASRPSIGRLHTTGKAEAWNCTGWIDSITLDMISPRSFPGYIRIETLKAGVSRAWFDTGMHLDAYVKALRAA